MEKENSYIKNKIFEKLSKECKISDEGQARIYVEMRKKDILKRHYNEVCRLYEPTATSKYYKTKLEPKNRKNQHIIYAKTKEELEEQIIAHYLAISKSELVTVRDVLIKATENDLAETSKRHLQRFDKHFSYLANIKISNLNENHIRTALTIFIDENVSKSEFNKTISALNKVAEYLKYEHIEAIDIKDAISTFRKVRVSGKHIFKVEEKRNEDLAFDRSEASKIVCFALSNPNFYNLLIALLITTGLRIGEALALSSDSINLEKGYIWVCQMEKTKSYEVVDYVKEGKCREVYLSDIALRVVKACISYRNSFTSDIPYLFLNDNSNDGKMHLRAIDNYMRTVLHTKVLGYGNEKAVRSPHDCRRTYASLEFLSGTDILTLKEQLGHSDTTQTWDYIKNIVEASERRNRLKGMNILVGTENNSSSKNAEFEDKNAETLINRAYTQLHAI